ncbi:MAG: hypothetical protein JWR26_4633 [Pedosphaera sp.]|nr:hypothetical protein [Pedosphaera sp.]
MSVSSSDKNSLRPGDNLIVWAIAISLAAHLLGFGGFRLGDRFGWWHSVSLPSWLLSNKKKLAELQKPKPASQAPQETPLLFVEVDPATATPEPPKNAKYYSTQNSHASNPDAQIETDTPKIDGTQTHVPKLEDTPRTKAFPLQPAAPKTPVQEEAKESESKGGQKPGDLASAKPAVKPDEGKTDSPLVTHQRPRTLAEVPNQQNSLAGKQTKQDGGVKQRHRSPTLDAVGSPFGDYDARIIAAISQRWYDLVDSSGSAIDHTGKVAVRFRLYYDGRVTDISIIENNVDAVHGILCQRAISDPAPYAPWSIEMRKMIGTDYREVVFTFFYD